MVHDSRPHSLPRYGIWYIQFLLIKYRDISAISYRYCIKFQKAISLHHYLAPHLRSSVSALEAGSSSDGTPYSIRESRVVKSSWSWVWRVIATDHCCLCATMMMMSKVLLCLKHKPVNIVCLYCVGDSMHMCLAWCCFDYCGIGYFTLAWSWWILPRLVEILFCCQKRGYMFFSNL